MHIPAVVAAAGDILPGSVLFINDDHTGDPHEVIDVEHVEGYVVLYFSGDVAISCSALSMMRGPSINLAVR